MSVASIPVVLYVDDDESNLIAFAASFRRHYTIYTASSAVDALHILSNYTVHVIITDQRMPGMKGSQLLEKVVMHFPNPTRILISAYTDLATLHYAIYNGLIFDFVSKPWDENEFLSVINFAYEYHLSKVHFGESYQEKELIVEKLRRKFAGIRDSGEPPN